MVKSDKDRNKAEDKPKPITNRLDHLLVAEDHAKVANKYIRLSRVVSRRFIICLVALALVLLSLYLAPRIGRRGTSEPGAIVQSDLPRIDNNDTIEDVVESNGADYNNSIKAVNNSNPTEWDRAKLDKAYFSLLYADKVGAFSQVYTMLSMIDIAQRNGLDINDNSYRIDQGKRDEIRKRADEYAKRMTKPGTGSANE